MPGSALKPASVGFYGKLPSRGDFVQADLPRAFTGPWEDWLGRVLPASRERLGEEWLPCWLEAPVWFFALSAGLCGPAPVLGLWMPSVDRVGRHYPLTLAMCGDEADPALLEPASAAGLAALAQDLEPAALSARLRTGLEPEPCAAPPLRPPPPGFSLWWSSGAPRVQPNRREIRSLPDAAAFTALLCDPA